VEPVTTGRMVTVSVEMGDAKEEPVPLGDTVPVREVSGEAEFNDVTVMLVVKLLEPKELAELLGHLDTDWLKLGEADTVREPLELALMLVERLTFDDAVILFSFEVAVVHDESDLD
jgi:hypothetical protein